MACGGDRDRCKGDPRRLAPPPWPAVETAHDWTGKPQSRAWVAPGWLPSGRVTLLAGEGGGGKSLFTLQLAAGIAGGDPNPFRCDPRGEAAEAPRLDGEPGNVLFATWEDEVSEFRRRLAWAGVDREALGGRLHVADMAGKGPLWGPEPGAHRDTTTGLTPAGEAVESRIRQLQPSLVVIDPTAGAFGSNEIDRAAVRAWGLATWGNWRRRGGAVARPSAEGFRALVFGLHGLARRCPGIVDTSARTSTRVHWCPGQQGQPEDAGEGPGVDGREIEQLQGRTAGMATVAD